MAQDLLKDKVVLVTGAGRGIGRAIAEMMADHGAKVVVNDLGGSGTGEGADIGPAQEVVDAIKAKGGEAVANTDSVSDWDAAQGMIQQAIDSFGRIDCVVNNAGILRDRIFYKMTQDEFMAVLNVHLVGSFNVASAAAPHFREQQGGSFVNFTSTSGLIGNFGQVNYMAAKLGIAGMSRGIALDMARFNVRSNCVSPFAWSRLIGTIPTNTPEEKERVERIKTMTPEKIAPLCVFLASDAAEGISGQIFGVRKNEIFLFSQPRPLRAVQRNDGWTPEMIAEQAIPAFKASMYPLEVSADVFSWDPV